MYIQGNTHTGETTNKKINKYLTILDVSFHKFISQQDTDKLFMYNPLYKKKVVFSYQHKKKLLSWYKIIVIVANSFRDHSNFAPTRIFRAFNRRDVIQHYVIITSTSNE